MSNYLGAGREAARGEAPAGAPLRAAHQAAPRASAVGDLLDLPRFVRDRARPPLELSLAGGGRGLPDLDVALARGDRRRALGARRLLGGRADHPGRRRRSDREGPRAERQDHRGRGRRRRVGQHRRHAAARGGQPDPRQEGDEGPPDRAAPGRRDAALPARDRARQDRSRRAGGQPALRDARAQRQAVQARDHRPALVLRRLRPGPAPVHRRRRERCSSR